MQRTTGNLRDEPRARLAALEQQRPEWRTWLRLLRVAAEAFDDSWFDPLSRQEKPAPGSARTPPARAESPGPLVTGAPLLDGRAFRVNGRSVAELLTRLLAVASGKGNGSPATRDVTPTFAMSLLEAAVRQEADRISELAARLNLPPERLVVVGYFLALPLLHASARALSDQSPTFWPHGHCPVCGGRATLAELRGPDRARLLRCTRCGSAWQMTWLRCAYCGERDHEKLGALVPEQRAETQKVETCASCRGYLKTLTALEASPLIELLLRDLETLDLDLASLDRGYARPVGPGYAPDVRVSDPDLDASNSSQPRGSVT